MATMKGRVHYAYITDFGKLVKSVAEGKAPLGCLLPNEDYMNYIAGTGKLDKAEGINIRTALTVNPDNPSYGKIGVPQPKKTA
ncbi:MAG: hypothetical protein ACTSYY_12855 [Promethearchaeota archaeon]